MRFAIPGIPAVGMALLVDGQRYVAIAVDPYRRKDGGDSFLITWRAPCAACGVEFTHQTGTAGTSVRRRCPACRPSNKSPVPVSGKHGQRVAVTVVRS